MVSSEAGVPAGGLWGAQASAVGLRGLESTPEHTGRAGTPQGTWGEQERGSLSSGRALGRRLEEARLLGGSRLGLTPLSVPGAMPAGGRELLVLGLLALGCAAANDFPEGVVGRRRPPGPAHGCPRDCGCTQEGVVDCGGIDLKEFPLLLPELTNHLSLQVSVCIARPGSILPPWCCAGSNGPDAGAALSSPRPPVGLPPSQDLLSPTPPFLSQSRGEISP